jgi:hypothetical protein
MEERKKIKEKTGYMLQRTKENKGENWVCNNSNKLIGYLTN